MRLLLGDCVEVMADLPDESVDAIVTDPPYLLGFMGKEWDSAAHHREMQTWHLRWATEALRVLKPGGHLLAFGGSRTYHRMACAVEDAGFEIRDQIMWVYGSGFPKSLDVSKAIDKAAGAEREVVGRKRDFGKFNSPGYGQSIVNVAGRASREEAGVLTAPATPDAERWNGWGTALKPSHEPVVWATKPLSPVLPWQLLDAIHHGLGAVVCLLSRVNGAEESSPSSPAGTSGDECVSVLCGACLASLTEPSGQTGTFRSPAAASTALSIASSWNAILVALSTSASTSTTSTASSLTTALRILSSSLSGVISLNSMPPCGCLINGSRWSADGAPTDSSGWHRSWLATLRPSVTGTAFTRNAERVADMCAAVAESISDEREPLSTARLSATTQADARLEPAHEPIVVARKPLIGTVADNVLRFGTGAINVDGCRVGTDGGTRLEGASDVSLYAPGDLGPQRGFGDVVPGLGRWPANLILDPEAAAMLDEQSGVLASPGPYVQRSEVVGIYGPEAHHDRPSTHHGDSGGASRFFYCAKASSGERNAGLEGMEQLPHSDRSHFQGLPDQRMDHEQARNAAANHHPTVKPIDLMRYLVRLVTPPGGTVLDPFMGSGTTGIACHLESKDFIGIEQSEDYLAIAEARIDHWTRQGVLPF